MRILLVAAVLLLLAGLLYRVLRPLIRVARQFLKAVRHFQQMGSTPIRPSGTGEKLVQCQTCGTWIPQSRTLIANSLEYCSRECVKRAGVKRRRNTAA